MITAERKPLDEILELVGDKKKVLVAGCDTCVAICLTGGEKEAEILASELRIKAEQDGREVEVEHTAAIRQCEWEYLDMIAEKVEAADVVLSMACGIGIQSLAEKFAPKLVMPAVNTNMLGMPQEHAVWLERCVACGECRIGLTGGICPVVRCSKSLMNGPCGGSHDGLCEVTGPGQGRDRVRLGAHLGASQGPGPRRADVHRPAAEGLEQEQLRRPPQDGA